MTKKVNAEAKAEINLSFGINANSYGGRFVNKDGLANVEKRGMHVLHRISRLSYDA